MGIRIITEGDSTTVDVVKGEEVYDASSGTLYERHTGSRDEFDDALAQAKKDEAERAKNVKAAEAAADKAAKAEAKRTASAK